MLTDVELPSPGKKRVSPDKEVIAVATVDAYLWFHLVYRGDIEERVHLYPVDILEIYRRIKLFVQDLI